MVPKTQPVIREITASTKRGKDTYLRLTQLVMLIERADYAMIISEKNCMISASIKFFPLFVSLYLDLFLNRSGNYIFQKHFQN